MKRRLYGDDLLTRAELAKAIGKSKTTIRRWEAEGKLQPLVNERGVRLFRAADAKTINPQASAEALPQARAHVQTAAQADGDLAAEVFARLERGVGAVKIVTELRVTPDVVDGLLKRWARFREGIVLAREDVIALENNLGFRLRRLTAECFVETSRKHAERLAKCMHCKKEEPRMCSSCVADRTTKCHWCQERQCRVCEICLSNYVGKTLAQHGIKREEEESDDDEDAPSESDTP
jgi:transcriptional regulator with XRE-family HTH domain